jgi:formylglycine-generating enzyme
MRPKRRRASRFIFLFGMALAALLVFLANKVIVRTSTDAYCASCHVHPHSTQSWKLSTHHDNKVGIHVHCVDCHLPPHGEGYLAEKVKTGLRDVWSNTFKDPESFNWEEKSQIDYATGHTFETSCIHCHQNNYPLGLTKEGREAHLYYERQAGELHCINCHITVGHYDPDRMHAQNSDFGIVKTASKELYTEPWVVNGFNNFTEYLPGSAVSFDMVAIPGGTYMMGSPEDEPFRNQDEGPVREVEISPFFMARIEVSWDEYMAFFKQTGAQGKSSDTYLNADREDVDGISGPTPPYGAPDQGWGIGKMPAMSMTHHAAEVYCEWLTAITGKTYRLPTEAEWEYAARGGTTTPYFFKGDPRRYVDKGIRNKIFGVDTAVINSYIIYAENSGARSRPPSSTLENPFGLVNMLGNVLEFCSDWYADEAYSQYAEGILKDPSGPDSGEEYVVRGGSYRDGAELVRCASRDYTRTDTWLKTDPQIPKSVWWYSDCFYVGFRVVCEFDEAPAN